MARSKNIPEELAQPAVNEQALSSDLTAMREAHQGAMALAAQLGYEGALTIGTLEDEIRFYQRRTVEACLELGKRLLILKEMTAHGEFAKRLEVLGFADRTAQRFMQAAGRTAKSANLALLSTQVKSVSAFLELVTQDDEVLQNLADMDDVDQMSASELRLALREERGERQAQEELNADKSKKIDTLKKQLKRIHTEDPDKAIAETMKEATVVANDAIGCVTGSLRMALRTLINLTEDRGDDQMTVYLAGLVGQVQASLSSVRAEFNLPDLSGAEVPEWVQMAQAEEASTKPAGKTV